MSYQQFTQECEDCHGKWNAAFGIVGTTQIASAPTKCPHCGSASLISSPGWQISTVMTTMVTELEREASAFRAMIKYGLQYHRPDEFNDHHRISNRHGEFVAEGGTALDATEKAAKLLEAKE